MKDNSIPDQVDEDASEKQHLDVELTEGTVGGYRLFVRRLKEPKPACFVRFRTWSDVETFLSGCVGLSSDAIARYKEKILASERHSETLQLPPALRSTIRELSHLQRNAAKPSPRLRKLAKHPIGLASFAKIFSLFLGLAYATGFVVTFVHLSRFGIQEVAHDLFRLKYIHTGFLCLVPPLLLVPGVLVFWESLQALLSRRRFTSEKIADTVAGFSGLLTTFLLCDVIEFVNSSDYNKQLWYFDCWWLLVLVLVSLRYFSDMPRKRRGFHAIWILSAVNVLLCIFLLAKVPAWRMLLTNDVRAGRLVSYVLIVALLTAFSLLILSGPGRLATRGRFTRPVI